ncbi:hypothetical protein ACFQBQ_02240 [Granulicella cerasi]|uniref:Agarase n=2 Tax=Granulicella cerasi TaxID=741063 RepID=A0ABW1Z6E0_9BACT
MPPKSYKTRVMEQLAGFQPSKIPLDKWGGRMDVHATPTGFFYTKKIGDRWYAIDPEGNAYFHQAVVNIGPNPGPAATAAMQRDFNGDKKVWMARTHAYLQSLGINGAGAWSNTDLIRNSPLQAAHPIAYTVILDVMSSYGKNRGGMHADIGHAGYLNDVIFAFDPEFEKYADNYIKQQVSQYKNDPAVFGYFSDNEMPVRRTNLEHYLDLPHNEAGYQFAKKFMDDHHAKGITDELSEEFLAVEIDHYASVVSAALKKYDPNHMYIGCRYTGQTEQAPEAFAALGKYADAISVNYYNAWTPDFELMRSWEEAAHKPIMITEWYTKGRDSGMPNKTGAGWLVATQAQRGAFYQNFALALIESKIVIGWHWFKYQDNDPNDPKAEASNKDSNKGIVNIQFQPYQPLTDRIRQLNPNAYALADYFDHRTKP